MSNIAADTAALTETANKFSLWGVSFTDVGYNIGQVETLAGSINRHHSVFWEWFIVNTNGGNVIRTCYSETWLD